nr:twin-arginine translocation signal domain-containing protein [Delftia lacustris]
MQETSRRQFLAAGAAAAAAWGCRSTRARPLPIPTSPCA